MSQLKFARLIILPLIVLYFLSAASVYGKDGVWTSVRSNNFFLAGDAGEAEIRAAAYRLEEFRQVFGQMFPGLKLEIPGVPTNVIVFKDAAGYRPFKPKRADGTADDAVAGYFQAGIGANYITLSLPEASAERFGTIFHEYVHFVMNLNFGSDEIPAWLNEGLAEYFETMQVSGGRTVSIGGLREDHLKLLRRSELLQLSDLFAMDNSSVHGGGDTKRSLFYAQSWALLHFLAQKPGETGSQKFDIILSLIKGTENPETAVRTAFGKTNAEFEKVLRAFITQPPASVTTFTLSRPIDIGIVAVKPVTAAESNAHLADLLYYSNRDAEAADYVRKSLAIDPKLPTAHGTLGLILMRQEKYAQAKKHLEIAARTETANAFVVFNYAYSMIREAMNEKSEISGFDGNAKRVIESELRRAVKLNPEFAESYRLLAFVNFVQSENLDEAAALVKKAAGLDPANGEHSLLLAQIYLLQEKYNEARDAAERLESLSPDIRIRNDARDVIAAVREYLSAKNGSPKNELTIAAGNSPLLILNRSEVSDADVVAYEKDRQINNLNRILPRLKPGEKHMVALVERMRCFDDRIEYSINMNGQKYLFTNKEFSDLRLSVITDGERTFQLECGTGFGKQLTVLAFLPPKRANTKPELTAITFVPDIFKLKTAAEMARARHVVIVDDTRHLKPSKKQNP